MTDQRVIRIKRADVDGDADACVLVNVVRVGASALDLRLVATEGESPYVGTSSVTSDVLALASSTY